MNVYIFHIWSHTPSISSLFRGGGMYTLYRIGFFNVFDNQKYLDPVKVLHNEIHVILTSIHFTTKMSDLPICMKTPVALCAVLHN